MNMPLPLRIFFIIFFISGIVCGIIQIYDIYQKECDRRTKKRIAYEQSTSKTSITKRQKHPLGIRRINSKTGKPEIYMKWKSD